MRITRRAALARLLAPAFSAPFLPGRAWAQAAGTQADIFALKVDYSATSVLGAGDNAPRGRLWRAGRALRHESGQGQTQTLIVRLDRNIGWLALADLGIAIESDLSALDLPLRLVWGGSGLLMRGDCAEGLARAWGQLQRR